MIVTHKQHGHMQVNSKPTIQTTTPTMEMRRERKAKGRPNRKPRGLQSPSPQHMISLSLSLFSLSKVGYFSALAPSFIFLSLYSLGLPGMFSSQFDANSAFNGGGFMSSQANDTGYSSAKNRETQGVVPVTVKQISEASHSGDDKSNFVIDGVEVTNVTLIGMVSKKAERVTDVSFTLDDGTGRIDCNRWVNEVYDTKEMEDIQDGIYVRSNGRLKSSHGRRQLVAFSVRPVTNFDEISFHFIECIHYHLQNSRTKLQGDATTQPHSVNPSLNTAAQDASKGYQTAPANQFSGQFSADGLEGFDQMVIDYLQQPSNFGREKGVHRDELSQKLKIPMEKIMESIRTLEEEGLIYSTIDEFHFKSTTSG